ncbi:MAG: tetratricopeptide repeat protein [Microcoleus sp.]
MSKPENLANLLKIPDERALVCSDLKKFQASCFTNTFDGDPQFEKFLKIWDVTSEILWALGYWQDYLRCCQIALQCAKQLKKQNVEGRILNEMGWAQMEQEYFEIAQNCFSQSLQIFRKTGDRISQGQSIRYLGVLHFRRRYFGLALKYYKDALTIVQEELEILQEELKLKPSDRQLNELNQRVLHQQAELHNVLGNLYLKLWNANTCRQELIAGLQGFRNLQKLYISPTPSSYRYFQPAPLLNLGRVAMLKGQYRKAQHYFDRCYKLSDSIDRSDMKAGVLLRMAELARVQGKTEEAQKLAQQAQEISEKEAPPLSVRAGDLRFQMRGDRRQQIKAALHQVKMSARLTTNLVIYAPCVLLQSVRYYFLFLTAKLTSKLGLKNLVRSFILIKSKSDRRTK